MLQIQRVTCPPAFSSPTPRPRRPPSRIYRPDTYSHTIGTRTRSHPARPTRRSPLPGFCSSSPWPPPSATVAPSTSTMAPPCLSPLRTGSRTACTTWLPRTSIPRGAARSASFLGRTADRGTTRISDSEKPWRPPQRRDTEPFETAGVASSRSSTGTAMEAAWTMTLGAWHPGQIGRHPYALSGRIPICMRTILCRTARRFRGCEQSSSRTRERKKELTSPQRYSILRLYVFIHHWVRIASVFTDKSPYVVPISVESVVNAGIPANFATRGTRPNVRSYGPRDVE